MSRPRPPSWHLHNHAIANMPLVAESALIGREMTAWFDLSAFHLLLRHSPCLLTRRIAHFHRLAATEAGVADTNAFARMSARHTSNG